MTVYRRNLSTISRLTTHASNGHPVGGGYTRSSEDTEREREAAALVAAAQARADAMPGAIPRCRKCRKPQAECRCLPEELTS